ncbi:MAG: hypothetical protein J6K74_03280 [Marinifilaceae bacterium]|nr:hypothetical protein [Marinifilaceae bacterium]
MKRIKFIKSMLMISILAPFVACSEGDNGFDINGSWISHNENYEDWSIYTFDYDASVSYQDVDGVKFTGTYSYSNKDEVVAMNITNTNSESYSGIVTLGITEVDGYMLLDLGEEGTSQYYSITPATKIVGEWRWRNGDDWKKYIFKSNGEFDLIDNTGSQSRGTYTYHKADRLLVIKTTYAESGTLGEEIYLVNLYKELILLEEPNGDSYIYENIN